MYAIFNALLLLIYSLLMPNDHLYRESKSASIVLAFVMTEIDKLWMRLEEQIKSDFFNVNEI